MHSIKSSEENYKNDATSSLEKRAFRVIFRHLIEKNEITLGEFFKLLSGVRLKDDPRNPKKVTKSVARAFLRKWHKSGVITVLRNRVRLSFSPALLRFLDHKVSVSQLILMLLRGGEK